MNANIGDNIREYRKLRGLNQDELAELARLNRVTVAKYESGKVEPGASALSRIADVLDVSVDILLGRSPEPHPSEDSEVWQIRERLRRDPNFRLLYNSSKSASSFELKAAAAMLLALRNEAPDYYPDADLPDVPEDDLT